MRLYEFEGKALFKKFKISVPNGTVVTSADEAESVAGEMNVPVVLKSQVLTGGRGKASGIKLIDTPGDVKSTAKSQFDLKIKGFPVEKLEALADAGANTAKTFKDIPKIIEKLGV